jgi:UDP-N-acetylmuramoyl-tripeptide--D-alanyl-D-alanine ligase
MSAILWNSADAADATGGKSNGDWVASGISIDTRTLESGDLFVAIDGVNQDGHKFIEAAFEKGACAAMVSRGSTESGPTLRVPDTLEGLDSLATYARRRVTARIAAITGSVGKTSTKEALGMALAASGRTHISAASYNNLWGVPLSIARMPTETDFAVFEIGMNHAGEIRPLAKLVRAHVAVITTVAPVHTEFFSSVDEIANEKGEVFSGLEPDGVAIINADIPHYERLRAAALRHGAAEIVGFGASAVADVKLVSIELSATSSRVVADVFSEIVEFQLGVAGRHMAMNALAVLASVHKMGGDVQRGAEALADIAPLGGRGRRHVARHAGAEVQIIDESYNANPASMRAAICVLGQQVVDEGARRMAVLGDMLELGAASGNMHADLAQILQECRIDCVFLAGPQMSRLWEVLPKSMRGGYAPTSVDLVPKVLRAVRDGDILMVKGSLGSNMSTIIDALIVPSESRGAH